MAAMIFKLPPQFGQWSMSISKTRLSSLDYRKEKLRIECAISCAFVFLRNLEAAPVDKNLKSLNHLIRTVQHVRRNRQTDFFGCIEIDDELELCWLLDGYVSRLSPFENLVHLDGDAMK